MMDKTRQDTGFPRRAPPIVGRSAERVLLLEQLQSVRSHRGQLCILSGEAGIGKTTMVRELEAAADLEGMHVLVGQCYDLMAAPPYGIWMDLASSYQPVTGTDIPLPKVLVSGELHNITSQSDVFDQVRSFLSDVSATQPTLVILEDVHWADPAILELLRHIASHLKQLRLCLVITYRVDELTRQNHLYRQLPALIRESGGLRIDLGRLHREDLAVLVSTHYALPEQDVSRLVDFLARHSDGNPFFAIELLRALEHRPREGLWWDDSEWHLGELEPLVVPAFVRHVIDARLDRLGPSVREPLVLAAVIGQDVSLDLWRSVSGLQQEDLINNVEIALDRHIVVAATDGTRIRFVHALTREALYESIPPPRRRVLHRQVAETLIAIPNADPDAVAYHLHRAGDPRTTDWMIRAGERAQRAYAWLTAWDRFKTAADALADIPGEELTQARLLYRCGRLQRYADASRGIESLRRASRLAEIAGDQVLAAEATYSQGVLHCYADVWDSGVSEITAGIERLEAMPVQELRISGSTINWIADALPAIDLPASADFDPATARLTQLGVNHRHGSLPWFQAVSGHLERAQAEAETFLGHVDAIDVDAGPLVLSSTGHALFGLGITRAAAGDPEGAQEAFEDAREIYARLDHHAVIAFVWLTELQDVVLRYSATDLDRREHVANEAQTALERAGGALPSDITFRRAHLPLMWVDGRWQEAWEIASDSSLHGNYALRRPVTTAIALIAYHQGNFDAVWEHIGMSLPAGLESAPGTAVLHDGLLLQRLAAALVLDTGDPELARQWLEANDHWLAWSGSVLGRAENELSWACLEMDTGNLDTASERVERAMLLATNPDQPLARISALRTRGVLAGRQGSSPTAEANLISALELTDACAAPFERARTLLELAELRTGDSAANLLNEARMICTPLHAAPMLARIDALAGRGPGDEASPEQLGGLTTRECEVLRLVAQGLTDADIGERLFISHRTASQHLRSVYGKLDVRSRAAATRYALEHDLT